MWGCPSEFTKRVNLKENLTTKYEWIRETSEFIQMWGCTTQFTSAPPPLPIFTDLDPQQKGTTPLHLGVGWRNPWFSWIYRKWCQYLWTKPGSLANVLREVTPSRFARGFLFAILAYLGRLPVYRNTGRVFPYHLSAHIFRRPVAQGVKQCVIGRKRWDPRFTQSVLRAPLALKVMHTWCHFVSGSD